MTKKKNSRQKHQKDVSFADTTDEELSLNVQGKSCQHVQRGIHFGRVKKSLKSTQSILTCNGCASENLEELPEVWLCLQCGYTGCGRTSENKHALQHFKTIHSDCHSLVLSTSSGIVWCYDCDDEINLQSSSVLKQCVEFVMKLTLGASNKTSVNKAVALQKLQNSVIKEETTVKNSEESESLEKSKKVLKNGKESPEKVSVKGLRNLGNTCFFNAVMQNLNQTSLLYNELKNTCTLSHLWEVPELVFTDNEVTKNENGESLKLSLSRQLSLTNSLFNFFEQMSAKSSTKVDIINPSPLFGEISKKCPQFRHFQQQDSHELLRQLLDGVRQEELKRQKKAILRYLELENVSPDDVDEELKKKCKAYGCYASHSIIEKVFGGLLISTVLCEECKMSSQIFEPFMDLSLPLFEEKQQENNEQLCAMLDGGKQDFKPLRNRKSDFDADEDNSGEYVLTKPKNEPGKPSKHQEKRQKMLAKKEKKRAKNSRNRKNSQTEINDGPSNAPLETAAVSEGEENGKDSAEEDSAAHDQQKENLNELDLVEPSQNNSIDEISALNNEYETCDHSIPELKNIENANHSEPVGAVDRDSKTEGNQADNPFEPEEIQNIENDSSTCLQEVQEATTEPVAIREVVSKKDEVNEIGKIALPLDEDSIEIHIDSDKDIEPERPKETTDEFVNNTCEEGDDTVSSLTKEFNCFTISESNECSLDDRIQALTMQVKDVRIRRDSDRQENILDSSESADDCESQVTYCTSPKSSIEDTCSIENGDNWSHSVSEQQTKEWILKSLTTLKPRHHVPPVECSINSCLSHFTKPELLTGNNKFRCEGCTELKIKKTGNKKDVAYSNASKQILIFSPPAVLTLHLKRFQQVGMSLRKVNRFVEFPLILDLAPFCSSACVILPHMASVEDEILYSLYGIVEHSGRLTSGHYTAYVKTSKKTINRTFECQVPLGQCNLEQLLHKYSGGDKSFTDCSTDTIEEKRQWFYISDSHVKEVSEAQVLKCQAYLLFYERIK